MKEFKIAFIFGLMLTMILGCAKEEIQPNPLENSEEASLKSAKAHGKAHYRPFKANIDLAAYFHHFGPIDQKDFQTDWVFPEFPPTPTPGMHVTIKGSGKATHLGKTEIEINQWWTRMHPAPPPAVTGFFSYGQGEITFTAANGDELYATYWGWADHQDDPPTEILTNGEFTGGTGRFVGASGEFLWDGLFVGTFKPSPVNPPAMDTKFGSGQVTVTGSISY